jgi:hypothetical protein
MTKVKVVAKLPDGKIVEVVAEPEMLSYISFSDPENPTPLESLIEIVATHPKLAKWRGVDLNEVQDLSELESDIADIERDLETLKQKLPPWLHQQFDSVSADKKELDSLKQKVQTEKQRRAQQPQ